MLKLRYALESNFHDRFSNPGAEVALISLESAHFFWEAVELFFPVTPCKALSRASS